MFTKIRPVPWLLTALMMSMAGVGGAQAPADDSVAPSAVRAEPLPAPGKDAAKPKPDERAARKTGKYDPQSTAMLLNYCRESLYKITEFNDRAVLDDEYSRLVNNIDITRIQDDEAAELIEALLTELNALRLNEAERRLLSDAYNQRIQAAVMEAFKGNKALVSAKDLAPVTGKPAALACQAIVTLASGIVNFKGALAKQEHQAKARDMQLRAEELNRLTTLRTRFFDTEYKLYKRYNLPDRLNLKEVQMAQYIKVLADEDSQRRLERLERLKEDFDAFPPFWYQIGKAAQAVNSPAIAKSYYAHFEQIQTHVFREDQDYVMLCMHRILLDDTEKDRDAIRHDLRIIEDNTRYYYKWESLLFAALMYYQLGDVDNARRLIRMSINEGYSVPLHESILSDMESETAKARLDKTATELVEKSDASALEALARVGPGQHLEALRAAGKLITDVTVTVSARSHAAQNMSYLIPGYNLYAASRALKGDAYFDNCVVHMPDAWFATGKAKVRLKCSGKTFKPSDVSRNPKAGTADVVFARVLKLRDIVEKNQRRTLTVHIDSPIASLDIEFEAKSVTPKLQAQRPELSPDAPYFELCGITYADRTYRLEDGVIVYKP